MSVSKKKTVFDEQIKNPLYQAHLKSLKGVKHLIDNRPPSIFVENVFKSKKLRSDLKRFEQITLENKQLLRKINEINRTKGYIDSFMYNNQAISSRLGQIISQNKMIEKENQQLYYRILTSKPIVETTKKLNSQWEKTLQIIRMKSKYEPVLNEVKKTRKTRL